MLSFQKHSFLSALGRTAPIPTCRRCRAALLSTRARKARRGSGPSTRGDEGAAVHLLLLWHCTTGCAAANAAGAHARREEHYY